MESKLQWCEENKADFCFLFVRVEHTPASLTSLCCVPRDGLGLQPEKSTDRGLDFLVAFGAGLRAALFCLELKL